MPGDAFQTVLPGERLAIPAAAYNAFLESARYPDLFKARFDSPVVELKGTVKKSEGKFVRVGHRRPVRVSVAEVPELGDLLTGG